MGGFIQAVLVNLWFVVMMKLLLRENLKQGLKHKLITVGFASALLQITVTAFLIMFDVHKYRSCNEVKNVILLIRT